MKILQCNMLDLLTTQHSHPRIVFTYPDNLLTWLHSPLPWHSISFIFLHTPLTSWQFPNSHPGRLASPTLSPCGDSWRQSWNWISESSLPRHVLRWVYSSIPVDPAVNVWLEWTAACFRLHSTVNFDVTFPPLANSNPWLQHSSHMQAALLAR